MWLIDANMDVHLVSVRFRCLLTRNNLLANPRPAPKLFPKLAVVVVNIPRQRWPEYRDQFVIRWTGPPD